MTKNTINYYVIGGQYRHYNYGGARTLNGAKRLSTKNIEYWDNWQGWHYPQIYRAGDCFPVDGEMIPKPYAEPIGIKIYNARKWVIITTDD